MSNKEKAKAAMEHLFKIVANFAGQIHINFDQDNEEDFDPEGGLLLVGHLCARWERNCYFVHGTINTSDPSVGIFGAWEPSEKEIYMSTDDHPYDVAHYLLREAIDEYIVDRLSDLKYEEENP